MWSRRRFLSLGVAGGGAAQLLGLAPAREVQILDALADRLFFAPGMPKPSTLGAGARAWAFAMELPAFDRAQLRGLLRAIDWGPCLRWGARFPNLGEAEQDAILTALCEAEALTPRLALQALRQLLAMGTFTHPTVWAAIGYDGPTIGLQAWEEGP